MTSGQLTLLKRELEKELESFDDQWASFEKLYVTELMVIETDARRYIVDAIELVKDIVALELKHRPKSVSVLNQLPVYIKAREKLILKINEINSIANTQGKGRADFCLEILKAAEEISVKPIT